MVNPIICEEIFDMTSIFAEKNKLLHQGPLKNSVIRWHSITQEMSSASGAQFFKLYKHLGQATKTFDISMATRGRRSSINEDVGFRESYSYTWLPQLLCKRIPAMVTG